MKWSGLAHSGHLPARIKYILYMKVFMIEFVTTGLNSLRIEFKSVEHLLYPERFPFELIVHLLW